MERLHFSLEDHNSGDKKSLESGTVRRRDSGDLILALVVLGGAALRFWSLDYGFPHALAHPDESRVAHTALQFVAASLNPGFFNYPTLFMYVVGAMDAAWCAGVVWSGRFPSISACATSWPETWEPFFMTGRLVSAVAGTASIVLVFHLARRASGRTAGLVAAVLLAVTFLHVRDSHFGVTDVSMTALLLAAVLLLLRAHAGPRPRAFAIAGLVAGLAMSTKYNAALLVVPAVISQAIALGDTRRLDWRLPAFGAAMVAGFLMGTPYALVDPLRFWADASSEARHLEVGHVIDLGIGWRYHFAVTLWYGLTWPLLAAAVAGAVVLWVQAPARAALLLSFPLAYYAVAGRGHTVFVRYMVPVVPFACVAASCLVSYLGRLAGPRAGRLPPAIVAAVLAAGLASVPLWQSIQLDRLLGRTDTRVLASAWIQANVPAGSTIYLSGSHYGRPELATQGTDNGYRMFKFDPAKGVFAEGTLPEWIVIQESALRLYSGIPDTLRDVLRGYQLRQAFRGVDLDTWHVFDQQDAFYVPLAGFAGVSRPGPNLFVYRRTD